MSKRIRAIVYGMVQGVSFRYYTQREALSLGLTGWVANRSDGTVEVVAEGPESELRKLTSFLEQGSPAARVNQVKVSWLEATAEFSRFGVRSL
jgi:acylphosphatase